MMMQWEDSKSAIEAQIKQRLSSLEKLGLICSLSMMVSAFILILPTINEAMSSGGSIIKTFGQPLILIAWAFVANDLLPFGSSNSQTRVGAAATIAWLPLVILALGSELIPGVLQLICAIACLVASSSILKGDLEVMRFRALMGIIGIAMTGALVMALSMPLIGGVVLAHGVARVVRDWHIADDNRHLRKAFKVRLDNLEMRLLILRSEGVPVDQASSLTMTAREEGFLDPSYGMRLLEEAEEDVERTLSLAADIDIIRDEALDSVEKAEAISTMVNRPRKAYTAGLREVELGSLREGEALFRTAKRRALDVIKWWKRAEDAISQAHNSLDGIEGEASTSLHEMLEEARRKLKQEKPQKAWEFASVIPIQLASMGEAMHNAEESIEEARKQLDAADGLDLEMMELKYAQANKALEQGDHSLARGLSEAICRELVSEREAMDDVRRALRQQKKLEAKFTDRSDAKDWQERLEEVIAASDKLEWTHAASLLNSIEKDLEAEGKRGEEVEELLEFVTSEWRTLRNQCEASGITVEDAERHSVEEAIAKAEEHHKTGEVDLALEQLGEADAGMERLRRRV